MSNKQTAQKLKKVQRSIKPLTDDKIRKLSPKDKLQDTTPGLYIERSKKGVRKFYLRITINNKQAAPYSIGAYPTTSLQQARKIAEKHRGLASEGKDPRKLLEQKTGKGKTPITLDQLVDAYADERQRHCKPGSGRASDIKTKMATYVYPFIDPETPATSLTKELLNQVVVQLVDRPETFKKVTGALAGAVNYLPFLDESLTDRCLIIETGYFKKKHERLFVKKATKPFRAVPVHAMPEYWDWLANKAEANYLDAATAIDALQFLILTGARTAEVIGFKATPCYKDRHKFPARWKEFDLEKEIWTIPGSRTKNGFPHIVPLSKPALTIIKRLKVRLKKTDSDDFVFASHLPTRKKHDLPGQGQLSNRALSKHTDLGPRYRYETIERNSDDIAKEKLPPTPHGFRTTLTNFVMHCGVEPHIASLILHHIPEQAKQDTSLANYWRSTMVNERRAIMDAWALYVTTGVKPRMYSEKLADDLRAAYTNIKKHI